MFVNEGRHQRTVDRTVDHERGLELRYVTSGPERPITYSFAMDGVTMAVSVYRRVTSTADGRPALALCVVSVGDSFRAISGPQVFSIPAYDFSDTAERERVCALIAEAFRVLESEHFVHPTPVAEVTFRLPALRAG